MKAAPADELRMSGNEFDRIMGQVLGAKPKSGKPKRTAKTKAGKKKKARK